MRPIKTCLSALLPLLVTALLPLAGAGCNDGPAEQAGERVDEAARDVRDTIDPPSGPVEAVGRKVDDATNSAP